MINVDSGAQCYAAISETLHRELNLPLIPIPDRMIGGPTSTTGGVMIQGVTYAVMEIQGFQQLVYFYVVPLLQHPIILGRPWEVHNQVEDRPHENVIRHGRSGKTFTTYGHEKEYNTPFIKELEGAHHVMSSTFAAHVNRLHKQLGGNASSYIMKFSITDIDKALKPKKIYTISELKELIPTHFHDLLPLFTPTEADKLPPHRPGIDHHIELTKDTNGKEHPIPWGPLYNMSREELLVLRKTLTELLDKGFIRASRSSAGAPV